MPCNAEVHHHSHHQAPTSMTQFCSIQSANNVNCNSRASNSSSHSTVAECSCKCTASAASPSQHRASNLAINSNKISRNECNRSSALATLDTKRQQQVDPSSTRFTYQRQQQQQQYLPAPPLLPAKAAYCAHFGPTAKLARCCPAAISTNLVETQCKQQISNGERRQTIPAQAHSDSSTERQAQLDPSDESIRIVIVTGGSSGCSMVSGGHNNHNHNHNHSSHQHHHAADSCKRDTCKHHQAERNNNQSCHIEQSKPTTTTTGHSKPTSPRRKSSFSSSASSASSSMSTAASASSAMSNCSRSSSALEHCKLHCARGLSSNDSLAMQCRDHSATSGTCMQTKAMTTAQLDQVTCMKCTHCSKVCSNLAVPIEAKKCTHCLASDRKVTSSLDRCSPYSGKNPTNNMANNCRISGSTTASSSTCSSTRTCPAKLTNQRSKRVENCDGEETEDDCDDMTIGTNNNIGESSDDEENRAAREARRKLTLMFGGGSSVPSGGCAAGCSVLGSSSRTDETHYRACKQELKRGKNINWSSSRCQSRLSTSGDSFSCAHSAVSMRSSASSNASAAYTTTSSIAMVLAPAKGKPDKSTYKEANSSISSSPISTDENNNAYYPNAYEEDLLKRNSPASESAQPPPPPPPPPPPMPPSNFSIRNSEALRSALEKRLTIEDNQSDASTKSSFRSNKMAPAQATAFIPPQFSSPPKDGTNIKPSEYLRRMANSASILAEVVKRNDSSSMASSASATSESRSSANSSSGASSGVGSNQSTSIGSLSSSTGASISSRVSQELSNSDNSSCGAAAGTYISRARSSSRNYQSPMNKFKQMALANQQKRHYSPLRNDALSLSRSQSTSALNHSQQEEKFNREEQKARDEERSSSFSLSSSEDVSSNQSGAESDNKTNLIESTSGGGGFRPRGLQRDQHQSTGNLMSALRQFDRSKLNSASNTANSSNNSANLDKGLSVKSESSNPLADNLLAATKRDLIAELKEHKDLDGIKRMKENQYKNKGDFKQALALTMPTFKAEDFLNKVALNEPQAPLWKRQMMAKKAAERARKDHEDKLKFELEQKRLSQVPQWKRQMLAKKAAEKLKRNEVTTILMQ